MKTYLEFIQENYKVKILTNDDWSEVDEVTDELMYSLLDLTKLPELPKSLRILRCHSNRLTKLPKLPEKLEHLDCSSNRLTSLPELPSNIKVIECYDNKLTELPKLPESLGDLDCADNQLTTLPELPESLYRLYCINNQLNWLPKLPEDLKELICYNNPLQCLIPERFYKDQNIDWMRKYLKEIQTYKFQKNLLDKDPNQIHELLKRNIIHQKIKEEYPDLTSSTEWGLI